MIIKNPLEDLQLRHIIINSNEDLKTLSQAKTAINDVCGDIKEELERVKDENDMHNADPYVVEMYEWAVERLDGAYSKINKVFQKLLKEVASKGENDGRTEE